MSEEVTYLELSEGNSHKFYEVKVKETTVSIRFGRIGDQGQTQSKSYPTIEKAKTEAEKKIREKLRKGYEQAVIGVRKKREITRRQVTSSPSVASLSLAPIVWKFNSGSCAFGIFIDADNCWVGNENGRIFKLNHQGEVINQFQLPDGVKCLVGDDIWIYAGCDDGNVYDLSGKIPRLAYSIDENIDIYWLDIYDGILAVSDANGSVVQINPEGESQWTRLSQGKYGWMVRIDKDGIYHGHSEGVTMYDLDLGRQIWHQKTDMVLFGWQEGASVYAGTSDKKIHRFSKQGQPETIYKCNASVYSCATTPQGNYVLAGDSCSSLYCFNAGGELLWKLATGCGSALSMQALGDRVYIVTTDGSLACVDVSESMIKSAQMGQLPTTRMIQTPASVPVTATSTTLETTSDTKTGVMVECVQVGGQLRVKVISPGYNSDWFVQFPKNIRELGARYLVQEIRESARGGFYRAYGEIKKLI